jgi:DNA-binding transcriptional LysR family regulator
MELRHLRYFVALAEELSFTAAARRLNISQPPLSQQIRDLESELGAALFQRTSRRVELTAAGALFLEHARSILAQVARASEQTRAVGVGKLGRLGIGTTGSVLLGHLGGVLADYRRHFPVVGVTLHEMAPTEQMTALVDRRIDISFSRTASSDPRLENLLAWREKVAVALPAGHPLGQRPRLELGDLRDQDHVFLRLETSPFAQYIQSCCIEAGFVPRIAQEVVEAYSLVSLVAAGMGVALVPASVQRLARQGVVYRRLGRPEPVADVHLIFRRHEASPVVRQFIQFARKVLSRAPTLAVED